MEDSEEIGRLEVEGGLRKRRLEAEKFTYSSSDFHDWLLSIWQTQISVS